MKTDPQPEDGKPTAHCLYEFLSESLNRTNERESQKKPKGVKKSKGSSALKTLKAGKTKAKSQKTTTCTASCTPLSSLRSSSSKQQRGQRLKKQFGDKLDSCKNIKTLSTPSLLQFSPIMGKDTSESYASKKKGNADLVKRTLRSSGVAIETPPVSFIKPSPKCNDDSAIFVSPRKTMPRFDDEKTSTPAPVLTKVKSKTKKLVLQPIASTNTSTPNEQINRKSRTRKKQVTETIASIEALSPMERMETPTSDYASMDSHLLSPSPTPAKQGRKKRASSPAFTLDEEESSASGNCFQGVFLYAN